MRDKLIKKIDAILDEHPEWHPFVNIRNFSNDELLDLYAVLRIELYLEQNPKQTQSSFISCKCFDDAAKKYCVNKGQCSNATAY